MGGINFRWLAVWVLSPEWLSCQLEVCDFCQAHRWSRRAWWRGVPAVPWLCIIYLGISLTTYEKSRKTLSQGIRKALGWPAPDAIRLVDLVIAGEGLDWPAGPCRPSLSRQAKGSTFGQRICRVAVLGGFPTSANFESKLAVRALTLSAKSGTPRFPWICLLLTYQGHP